MKWRTFIAKAIRPNFFLEDDKDTVYTARRGSLMAHKLTLCISELIMFVLDTKVYKETGLPLIRYHDDILFWDHSSERVTVAWNVLNKTLKRMGLAAKLEGSGHVKIPLNTSKKHDRRLEKLRKKGVDVALLRKLFQKESGTLVKNTDVPLPLPKGPVYWRLLRLNGRGEWELNDEFFEYWQTYWHQVAAQDPKCVSVMKLIKAYNGFGQDLLRMLCRGGDAMGKSHAELVVKTMEALHTNPLPNSDKGMIGILKDAIAAHHPDCKSSIPCLVDGWFYWPIRAGGLALKNFETVARQNTDTSCGLVCFSEDDIDRVYNVPKNYDEYLKAMSERDSNSSRSNSTDRSLPPPWRKITVPEFKEKGSSYVRKAYDVYLNDETHEVQHTRPKYHGDFDYSKCTSYERAWRQSNVTDALKKACVDVTEETGPAKDAELRKMIKSFLARKRDWVGAVSSGKTGKGRNADMSESESDMPRRGYRGRGRGDRG